MLEIVERTICYFLLSGGDRAGGHGGAQRGGSAVYPSRLLKTDRHLPLHRSAGG